MVKNPPSVQEFTSSAGDPGSIPGSRRSPGEVNGNRLQYACMENPIDKGTWWATVHEVTRAGHDLGTKPIMKKISWASRGGGMKQLSSGKIGGMI